MTGPNTEAVAAAGASARSGSIFDLGYRRYEGPRLGRAYAIRSLVVDTFRGSYGLGRGGRAKVAPIALGAIAILPAIIFIGVLTLAARLGIQRELESATPLGYDGYFNAISVIVLLFCAAQAPELFSRDQRHSVLALYFSRALRRSDYALARLAGFALALLVLLLLPQLILFIGRVLLSTDIVTAFGIDVVKVPAIVGQAAITAGLLGGLAMAVSAFTPRRAYATAGIIALFVVPGLVAGIVIQQGSSSIGDWLVLLSQGTVLDGTNAVLFNKPLPDDFFFFDLPRWSFVVAATVEIVVAVALVLRRFTRITA
jgi:ABC-2 type transport system permease protein